MGAVGVVFDTNILISALGWGGKPDECLRFALRGSVDLIASPATLAELMRVMEYPKFDFTEDEKAAFHAAILSRATVVQPTETIAEIDSDPDDNAFLACAVAGEADYIISGDRDLLELEEYRDIAIVTPDEFLRKFAEPEGGFDP